MFEPVKAAELTPADLIVLIPVSRVTASLWLNGHRTPSMLILDRVRSVLDAIRAAVEAGDLPIKDAKITRDERSDMLTRIVAKHAAMS